jgi:hypothetical protein
MGATALVNWLTVLGQGHHPSPTANLERTESGNGLSIGNFYVIYARGTRAFAQTLVQACQLFACALSQHLDGAVRIIADPACDQQDVSLALDKPAKADALNAAANQEAASQSWRLIFCGRHRSIAEVRGQVAEVKIPSRKLHAKNSGSYLCNLTSNL